MSQTLRIAVYTIALNEEKHVSRWFESGKDADLLLIADTGSTDGTIEAAEKLGVKVYPISVDPWRFDVARNASLALIPDDVDICIQLDMDEVLPFGWRVKVEAAWNSGNTWPYYKHVTARYPDGTARSYQHYFKIHPRKGFTWKYPIHEVITPQVGISYHREFIDLEVDHLQDNTKSRKSYLTLLESGAKEFPNDWRMAHYLNREYWYNKDWQKVINSAYSAMSISGGWDVERASTYMWASEAAHQLGFTVWAMEWAQKATDAAPNFYEAWHWQAQIAYFQQDWIECYESARKILVLEKQHHHLVKPQVWEWQGWDLLALGAHNLKKNDDALKYGERALQGAPNDERLSKNIEFYKLALDNEALRSTKELSDSSIKISLITPTRNREQALIEQYRRLLLQAHTNWEWLIYDDSDSQSEYFHTLIDRRVKYIHEKHQLPLSIGKKRNHLISKAEGDWIAHVDDDDLYGNKYLSLLLRQAISLDTELIYLKSWFYIDDQEKIGCYSSDSVLPRVEGWGFTFMYRKELAVKNPFPDNNWEDHFWFQSIVATAKYLGIDDQDGIVFKSVHSSNTSNFSYGLASYPDSSKMPHVVNALKELQKVNDDLRK